MLDLLTVFLSTCTLASVRLERHHNLVNQVFVVSTTKHSLGRVVFRRSLTLVIQEFELHQFAPFDSMVLALTAGRTVTKPPADPGTAPRIISS